MSDQQPPGIVVVYVPGSPMSGAAAERVRQALDEAGYGQWPANDQSALMTADGAVIVASGIDPETALEKQSSILAERATRDIGFRLVTLVTDDVNPEQFASENPLRLPLDSILRSPSFTQRLQEMLVRLPPVLPGIGTAGDDDEPYDEIVLPWSATAVALATIDDAPVVVMGDMSGAVRVWRLDSASPDVPFASMHGDRVTAVSVAEAGGAPAIVSTGYDGGVMVSVLAGGELLALFGPYPHPLNDLAVGVLDGRPVAIAAAEDGVLPRWDLATLEVLAAPRAARGGGATALAIAGAGARVVAAHRDGRLRSAGLSGSPVVGPEGGGTVHALVAAVLDGRPVVVSGDDEGMLTIWNARDAQPVGDAVRAHEGPITALAALAIDGREVVVSGGADGVVAIFDLASRRQSTVADDSTFSRVVALAAGTLGRHPIAIVADETSVRTVRLPGTRVTARAQPTADAVDWVSDARAKADLLQRRPLAQTLATRLNRLRSEEPGTSFLIHLDGRWGAGKSTVLDLLRDELAGEWLVVEFDAWRQMRVGPPWWALLASLRHAIRADLRWDAALRLRLAEAAQRGRRGGPLYAVALLALLALVVLVGLGVDLGGIDKTISSILVVLGGIGTLVAGASAVSRFLLWDSAAGAKMFEQSQRDPMDSIADHFGWLVARAGKPVVFFVDDLDRCSNDYVVAMLDAVQTLVRDAPARLRPRAPTRAPGVAPPVSPGPPPPVCHVIVAADGRWIRTSYEQAHSQFAEAVAEPGRSLGYLFLAKIFQLTVEVPSISPHRQDAFMRGLLRNAATGGDSADSVQEIATKAAAVEQQVRGSTSEAETLAAYHGAEAPVRAAVAEKVVAKLAEAQIERSTEHALERFAPLLEANPRAMKLFVNAYGVARALQVMEDNVVARDPLALWTILRTRWPGLADYIRAHPEAIEGLASGQSPSGVPKDVEALFGAPAVRRVITCAHGGPLTPALIRACCGLPEDDVPPPA